MERAGFKLGDRLIAEGWITQGELERAVAEQKLTGGLLGEILVAQGSMSKEELDKFLLKNQYSRLGEVLVSKGWLTGEQLAEALRIQKNQGGRLGTICVEEGFITEENLNEALRENKKPKMQLGQLLVHRGLITTKELDAAIEMQKKSGGRLGEVLLYLEYIDEETLYRELASQLEIGRLGENISLENIYQLSYPMARKYNAYVISESKSTVFLGVKSKLEEKDVRNIEKQIKKPVEQILLSGREHRTFWEQLYKNEQAYESVFQLYDEKPQYSAIVTFTGGQIAVFLALAAWIGIGLLVNWRQTLLVLCIIFQIIYAAMTLGKFYIVLKGVRHNTQMRYTKKELEEIDESKLPVYTILIPVYKEKEVVQKLLKNIGDMDYPKYKLDVRVLLEEGDTETIEAVTGMNLPFYYHPIIVPKTSPQTKPKACNYGLLEAEGEYVVIYDAEDRPEPDQLKKAYLAFKELPENYVCIQAKLNYFNSSYNWLTKLFTQEYSMWFELLLVGIMKMDIPIPLGGTSNHFKMRFLKEVGGWDPFNVTEDADLGIRLYHLGYKTAILDSRTWEEANSKAFNWIRQRSRWIKGYMQTWLVHMRKPAEFYRKVGLRGFIGYQAMILGTPLLPLINPVFWFLMILWYTTQASWIADLFPGILYYIGMIQFILGNFIFTYMNIIGMYYVVRDCAVKGNQPFSFGLIKYALLTPLYWLFMSIAAYKALIQLLIKPFYWEKTTHGLSGEEPVKYKKSEPA